MSETTRIWTETSFNIVYLVVIWWLVITMWRRREFVAQSDLRTADLIMWAFAFLGFGDIGHVGFRVIAFAMGGLDVPVTIFGKQTAACAPGLSGHSHYLYHLLCVDDYGVASALP